ncbi:hypothetical protein GOP47_0027225 [Adiantum capillus-veneris]|nr:hypothetical protein GOP47_0027225 [Adiantum capillus-veneris]
MHTTLPCNCNGHNADDHSTSSALLPAASPISGVPPGKETTLLHYHEAIDEAIYQAPFEAVSSACNADPNVAPTFLQATLNASSNPTSILDLLDAYIIVPLSPEHHFHPLPIERPFHTNTQGADTSMYTFPSTLTKAIHLSLTDTVLRGHLQTTQVFLTSWPSIAFDPGGQVDTTSRPEPLSSNYHLTIKEMLTAFLDNLHCRLFASTL